MARSMNVIRIFCRSSGIMKTALSFCMIGPLAALGHLASGRLKRGACPAVAEKKLVNSKTRALRRLFPRCPRLHLVFLRFLGRRDDLGCPTFGRDLLGR